MRWDDKIDIMNKLDQIDRNNQAAHSANSSFGGTGLPFLSGKTILKIFLILCALGIIIKIIFGVWYMINYMF